MCVIKVLHAVQVVHNAWVTGKIVVQLTMWNTNITKCVSNKNVTTQIIWVLKCLFIKAFIKPHNLSRDMSEFKSFVSATNCYVLCDILCRCNGVQWCRAPIPSHNCLYIIGQDVYRYTTPVPPELSPTYRPQQLLFLEHHCMVTHHKYNRDLLIRFKRICI